MNYLCVMGKLKDFYHKYRDFIRIDFIMYMVMFGMIIVYVLVKFAF